MLKSRLVASGVHFLGSAFVITIFLSIVYFVWYPEPFYIIHSVFDAVKIALVVDLVLGPFLTLVVYNTLKPGKELIRDLSLIIVIQVSALMWGIHITHQMRPLFFVFQNDTFYSIIADDIDLTSLDKNTQPPSFWQRPKWVYIKPLSSDENIKRLDKTLQGETPEGQMYKADKYKPLSLKTDNEYKQNILNKAISYTKIQNSPTWSPQLNNLLANKDINIKDYLFYPVINPGKFDGIIAFHKQDFSYLGLMQ